MLLFASCLTKVLWLGNFFKAFFPLQIIKWNYIHYWNLQQYWLIGFYSYFIIFKLWKRYDRFINKILNWFLNKWIKKRNSIINEDLCEWRLNDIKTYYSLPINIFQTVCVIQYLQVFKKIYSSPTRRRNLFDWKAKHLP